MKKERRSAEADRLRSFDDAEAVGRDVAYAHMLAGQVYSHHGEFREAEQHWRNSAALHPRDTMVREQLTSFYVKENRLRDALGVATQLCEIAPNNTAYLLTLGKVRFGLRQFHAAEKAYQRVIELSPNSSLGHVALAQMLLQTHQRLPDARALAEEAVRLEPMARNYYLLSAACASSGDRKEATLAIEQALALDPGNPAYERLHQDLQGRQ